MVIRWEEPPATAVRGRRRWNSETVADELRSRPGEWALVSRDVGSVPIQIKTGRGCKAFQPAGSFEATTRVIKGRLCTYARYVGGQRLADRTEALG